MRECTQLCLNIILTLAPVSESKQHRSIWYVRKKLSSIQHLIVLFCYAWNKLSSVVIITISGFQERRLYQGTAKLRTLFPFAMHRRLVNNPWILPSMQGRCLIIRRELGHTVRYIRRTTRRTTKGIMNHKIIRQGRCLDYFFSIPIMNHNFF